MSIASKLPSPDCPVLLLWRMIAADSLASSVSREAATMLGDQWVMEECLFY
jgi:hypothetical protein